MNSTRAAKFPAFFPVSGKFGPAKTSHGTASTAAQSRTFFRSLRFGLKSRFPSPIGENLRRLNTLLKWQSPLWPNLVAISGFYEATV
jgi:hypothetical protein